MVAHSPRNGASALNALISGSDIEGFSDREVISTGSTQGLRSRWGLRLGTALLLVGTAAAAALLLAAPFGAQGQSYRLLGRGSLPWAPNVEAQLLQRNDVASGIQQDAETGGSEELDGEEEADSEEGWGDEVAHTPLVDGIDKDGDGVVSDGEWSEFVNAVREALPDIADEVETASRDFNRGEDGKLNKHELGILVYHLWMNAVRQRFDHYDADSDGEVDKEELKPLADEIQHIFGLSPDDLEDVLDQAHAHPSAMWCARKEDAGKKWKWEECECRTPGDGKLSLCEVPVLLHAINRLVDS